MESYYKQNKKLITDILDILEGHFGKNVEFVVHDLSLTMSTRSWIFATAR